MRKIYFYLLALFIVIGCDSTEESSSKTQSGKNPTQTYIINGDIVYEAEITDGSKPKKPIFIYDLPKNTDNETIKNQTLKTSNETTVLNFNYGIGESTQSGCQVKKYKNDTEAYYTDQGVYGYNPFPQNNGYLVRGYGTPHHNLYYNSLILQASNNSKAYYYQPTCSAISIEYKFEPNVTYEISLETFFNDNRKLTETKNSEGFPSVNVYLNDSPILSSIDKSCEKDIFRIVSSVNYLKSYTLEDNIIKNRTLKFKFSPTEEKKALIISLLPKLSDSRATAGPVSNYTMVLPSVTIKELPFDSSINEQPYVPNRRQ